MAKQLNAEIEVQASPDRVWEVLNLSFAKVNLESVE